MKTNKKLRWISLIFIFFLALGIRLFFIFSRVPAGDEIGVLLLIQASFKDIWFEALAELHAPFYFLFLRAISIILGLSLNIVLLRVVSLFFNTLACIGIAYFGCKVLDKRTGLLAFLLSLFLPSSIWTAVFGRYYSFLILLTTLAVIAFNGFLKDKSLRYFAFLVGVSVVGIYTHYYFFLLIFCFGIYLFLAKRDRELLRRWIYLVIILSLFLTPALFYFFSLPKPQAVLMTDSLLKIPAALLANLTSFEALLYGYYQPTSWPYYIFFAALFVVLGILLILGFKDWESGFKNLFWLIIIFPPVFALLSSYVFKPIFGFESVLGINSLLIFLPAFLFVLAKSIDYCFRKTMILGMVFIFLIVLSQILFYQSSTWRVIFTKPFEFVKNELKEGDLVLHTDLYTFIQAKYYLKKDVNFGVIPTTYAPQTEKAFGYRIIPQETVFKHQGRLWYFEPEYYNVAEAKNFKTQLDKNLVLVKKERFESTSTVNVYLYENKLQ